MGKLNIKQIRELSTLNNLIIAIAFWIVIEVIASLFSLMGAKYVIIDAVFKIIPRHDLTASYLPEAAGYFVAGIIIGIFIKRNAVTISAIIFIIEIAVYIGTFLFYPLARNTIPDPLTIVLLEGFVTSFLILGATVRKWRFRRSNR